MTGETVCSSKCRKNQACGVGEKGKTNIHATSNIILNIMEMKKVSH